MERRKFIIGAGALATGSAAAVGTGAFSSVEAERTIDISTADDSDALLTLEPNDEYEGSEEDHFDYDNGVLIIDINSINREAVTTFEELMVIRNEGEQEVNVFVNNDFGGSDDPISGSGSGNDGPVDLQVDGTTMVGGNLQQTGFNGGQLQEGVLTIDTGEEILVDVEVDTRGVDDDEDLTGEYKIIAE